jgi:protein phosphatase
LNIVISEPSLVLLVGPSGCGKSTFARNHFKATEVISSDYCRSLISDDESDQSVTRSAFEVLRCIASRRLAAGRLTVIDATNVQRKARQPLLQLARKYHVAASAIVFDVPEEICLEQNQLRPGRSVPVQVITKQLRDFRRSIPQLKEEGWASIYVLRSSSEINGATLTRAAAAGYSGRKRRPLIVLHKLMRALRDHLLFF